MSIYAYINIIKFKNFAGDKSKKTGQKYSINEQYYIAVIFKKMYQ